MTKTRYVSEDYSIKDIYRLLETYLNKYFSKYRKPEYRASKTKNKYKSKPQMRRGYNRGIYSPSRINRSPPKRYRPNYKIRPRPKDVSHRVPKPRTEHYHSLPSGNEPYIQPIIPKKVDDELLNEILEKLESEFERLETVVKEEPAAELAESETLPVERDEFQEIPGEETVEAIVMETSLDHEPESWEVESHSIIEPLPEIDSEPIDTLEPLETPFMEEPMMEFGPGQLEALIEPLYDIEPTLDQIDLDYIGLLEPLEELEPMDETKEPFEPEHELEPLPEGEVEML
jgi:hypothetical protein